MNDIVITYKGEPKIFKRNTTYKDIVETFSNQNDILACKINGEVISLSEMATENSSIDFINKNSMEGRTIYKSAIKCIFINVVKKLYSAAEVHIDHSVPLGIYVRVEMDKKLTEEDANLIKKAMFEEIEKDLKFNKKIVKKNDAIKFYNSKKEYEKANNASNVIDPVLSLFEYDNNYNYFYSEMPYSSKIIDNFDLVYLNDNKFVIVLPTYYGEKSIYNHHEKIIKSFEESKEWLKRQNTLYYEKLNLIVGNGKIKKFIESNEIKFNSQIDDVVNTITKDKEVKMILIAGPSSSGKTTTTKRIASYLTAKGYKPINLSLDDYYLDRHEIKKDENGDYDFESVNALDINLFKKDINDLFNNKTIKPPVYDFIQGEKVAGNELYKLEENSIVLVEGINALNSVFDNIIDVKKVKIYLSPFMSINIDRHNYVSTIDLRLIRRIIRDNRTRGYGVATTIHNWDKVRKGEEKNIFPFIKEADIIINTALEYEIGVLKVYIEPLLLSVNINSPYYAEARRLLSFLKQFFPIPSEYVNRDSIIREFIGGN